MPRPARAYSSPHDPDRNPWDRLPTETDKQYAGFRCYLNLDPRYRSYQNAWNVYATDNLSAKTAHHRPHGDWDDWAQKNRWKSRARAYDAYMDRVRLEAKIEAERERIKRWTEDSQTVQTIARYGLSKKTPDEIADLAVGSLTWLLEAGQRMEQKAIKFGERYEASDATGNRIDIRDFPGLDDMSDEQVWDLALLMTAAAGSENPLADVTGWTPTQIQLTDGAIDGTPDPENVASPSLGGDPGENPYE